MEDILGVRLHVLKSADYCLLITKWNALLWKINSESSRLAVIKSQCVTTLQFSIPVKSNLVAFLEVAFVHSLILDTRKSR